MPQSLPKLAGLDWEAPGFTTVSLRQKHLSVATANATATRLHLLFDSAGIKMLGEDKWKAKKRGTEYRHR